MAKLYRDIAIEKLSSPDQLDKSIVITSPMSWIGLLGIFMIICAVVIWAFCATLPQSVETRGVISSSAETNSLYSDVSGTVEKISASVGDKVDANDVVCTVTDSAGNMHDIAAGQSCVISAQSVTVGSKINRGDELFGVSPVGIGANAAVSYVSVEEVRKLAPGMEVVITPVGVDSRKYGHMEGVVTNIDTYATSAENIQKVIGTNEDMLEYMGASSAPVCAVTCSIKADADSSNGFYWTASGGEELDIYTGAVVRMQIITEESAPISRLIPGYGMEE